MVKIRPENILIHAPPSQSTVIRAEQTSGLPLIQVWGYITQIVMYLQMCAAAISLKMVRPRQVP